MNRASNPGATNFFDNIHRTFSGLNNRLEKNVQEHLRNVYATVTMGIGAAAIGAGIHIFTNILRANILMAFASIAVMMALISTPHTRENEKKRLGYFFIFCGISGISMGPLLERVMEVDPSCVLTALLASTAVFGCFSLVALNAPSTKYIHMGGTLASAALCLVLASFFASYYAIILGGLALSCAFVVYDTQLIAEKSRRGEDDYIWHSVELFIDFANIFKYLLVILADKRERDNRKRRA